MVVVGGNKLSISALWKHAACNSNGETDVDREHLTSLSASACAVSNGGMLISTMVDR